ncbi:E3 ubiquitin-protein ligase TRIM45-like isoform X4 [Neopsephotus bourkii]|uniref:E3 ubiquitin-protein ligase TRIM45-like isoform X4 n=1 Tax=Neopsephotus bourkii TaxID=309878 RepID=UPI002AA53DCD|nr:E3 ubiquitin-protein ligase TRIM45-like isoform X4 [Neopsephotus bourkii]
MSSGPRCPVCHEPWVSPRLLPCLHSLCSPCLRRLGTLEEPGRAAARSVLCPVCDAEVSLPPGGVEQLIPDYLALSRGGAAAAAASCDLCVDGAAVRRCLTCGADLCHFCCQAHRRQKKTASHTVTELENSKDCNQAGEPLLCPSHPTEELRLFCEQCDQPVCQHCAVGRHRQHTCDFTGNVIRKHGDALRELLKSTQQHMGTLESALSQIDAMGTAVHGRAEAVATEICLFASGYVKAIEEHRDRLLKQLEDLKVQKVNLLRLQKAQLQQLLLDMRTGVGFTEHLLASGSDVEILITKGVVASRLAKLNRVAYNTQPSMDDGIQFSPQEKAGQCCGYEVFGTILNKAVDPARCTLHGEDLHSAHQNQLTGFTLLCNDTMGERMERGGEAVQVTITHKDKRDCTVKPTVCDNGDGTYHVSYSPEEPGVYAVCVSVKGQHVQGSPFTVMVKGKFREHHGVFHCCTFCSSGGQKSARCACGGTMPGGYQGCGHGHKGHPGCPHWSCCGQVKKSSECLGGPPSDALQRSLLRTVAL